jgi:hypothetical protein
MFVQIFKNLPKADLQGQQIWDAEAAGSIPVWSTN